MAVLLFLELRCQAAARGDKGGGVGRLGGVCMDGSAAGGGGEGEADLAGEAVVPRLWPGGPVGARGSGLGVGGGQPQPAGAGWRTASPATWWSARA